MSKNTNTTAETKTLTEAEKKAKRNLYARAYYAQHKEARKEAVKKCRAKRAVAEGEAPATEKVGSKPTTKKAGCKPAAKKAVNPHAAKKAVKETPELKALRKAVEKAQKVYDKAVAKVADAKVAMQRAKDAPKSAKAALKAAT